MSDAKPNLANLADWLDLNFVTDSGYSSRRVYRCPLCSAIVYNRELHRHWHETLAGATSALREMSEDVMRQPSEPPPPPPPLQPPHQSTRPHYYRGFHNSDPDAQGYAAHCGCGWHSTWQRGGSLNELAAVLDYFEHRLDTASADALHGNAVAVCDLGVAPEPVEPVEPTAPANEAQSLALLSHSGHAYLLSVEFAEQVCSLCDLDRSPYRAQYVSRLRDAIRHAILTAISDITTEEMGGADRQPVTQPAAQPDLNLSQQHKPVEGFPAPTPEEIATAHALYTSSVLPQSEPPREPFRKHPHDDITGGHR